MEKSKTEMLVKYRGRHARKHQSDLARNVDDDSNVFVVPPSNCHRGLRVVVTDSYKHLGTLVTLDGNLVLEARHRATSAMSAFVPLSIDRGKFS